MKLLDLPTFLERYFDEASRPHPRTVRSWIDNGQLPGKRMGRYYYVDEDEFIGFTGDSLTDRVMQRMGATET